ncbi:hypothetical protein LTR10_018806 [Elasticomyces elasticus]|uniref:Uncharacterized protein n=1 Tax=Exophiala sideris TaxID=1016849 RepID=A0ABR0J882_9EURO|nr:hypothetical protein LTR10_018806 [Elasticomyces elasticus]KAK5029933.1 hypothetical protein LTS07_005657 [Exophiala sideris]KAK5031627.1 hypothetical protein LTR13_007616 [Exophiala sideris]KAK5058305.1 hypothetical protein LTR69_006709 [Exophiala sideris]KAK5180234.1 hypothetical protein LTR44_007359 [Eurotiomycetes sp. CCFEE 6388]
MGDAGPPTPPPFLAGAATALNTVEAQDAHPLREVKVLVTGFGPFKSFLINPSWLIASALPDELYPITESAGKPAYKIKLIIHNEAIRVSYSVVAEIMPTLIAQYNPDYIVHIGMAGGRDCYSLETRGHRDGYRIKDVDCNDGFLAGEAVWKKEGVPDVLAVRWDELDVLSRWQRGVKDGLESRGFLGKASGKEDETPIMPGTPMFMVTTNRAEENRRKAVVKLSRDAGRFLCEYALFASLSRRWLDADPQAGDQESRPDEANGQDKELARERLGKVAFLHVPGWTGVEDVNRGVMIAEEAIRALVGSWEDGRRSRASGQGATGFTNQHSEVAGVSR